MGKIQPKKRLGALLHAAQKACPLPTEKGYVGVLMEGLGWELNLCPSNQAVPDFRMGVGEGYSGSATHVQSSGDTHSDTCTKESSMVDSWVGI